MANKVSRCERAFLRYKDPKYTQDNHHHEKSTEKERSESMKLYWLVGILRTKVVNFQCLISKPSRQWHMIEECYRLHRKQISILLYR